MSRDERMQLDTPAACPAALHVARQWHPVRGGSVVSTHKKKAGSGWRYRHAKDAAKLLAALETLQFELGSVGKDIISMLRDAGVTPAEEVGSEDGSPVEG
jgi:hypothetical protein